MKSAIAEKVDAAGAEAVRHPAADRNEEGEAEGVAREHRLHAERVDVERAAIAGTAVFRMVVSSALMKKVTATSQGRRRCMD